MSAAGKTDEDEQKDRKGANWKAVIAMELRKHSMAGNPWIAKRLNMGHPSRVTNPDQKCSILKSNKYWNSTFDPFTSFLLAPGSVARTFPRVPAKRKQAPGRLCRHYVARKCRIERSARCYAMWKCPSASVGSIPEKYGPSRIRTDDQGIMSPLL